MLSEKALKALGITNPQEGMEIPLNVSIGIFQSSEETFSLSGWFTDHSNEAAPGYISEKKLELRVIFQRKSWMSGAFILMMRQIWSSVSQTGLAGRKQKNCCMKICRLAGNRRTAV